MQAQALDGFKSCQLALVTCVRIVKHLKHACHERERMSRVPIGKPSTRVLMGALWCKQSHDICNGAKQLTRRRRLQP